MAGKTIEGAKIISSPARRALGLICILLVLSLLIGAASLPFFFESQSIRYKLGLDKTLLRTGKVLGLIAATLFLLQLLLSARFKMLDRIFGLNRLYIFHRVNAVTVAALALLHPLFVFSPEDITSIPVELKYWPEILGASLLVLIWFITASGIFRLFLRFSFHRWWFFHRLATFSAFVIVILHILFVSDTFESGWPRFIVFLSGGIYALIFGWVKIKPTLCKMKPYEVTNITKAGKDTYSVEVSPQKGSIFKYIPGQFAFISFRSENLSAEEHPFTISSTPTRPESFNFSIRCSGDWSSGIGRIKRGDTTFIDGPYGHFSYFFCKGHRERIMIAGGIGITPMLSMLRYMADTGDTHRITLIWSNRTEEDIVFADEFMELGHRLKGLRIIHVLTRQPHDSGISGRLNRDKLGDMLSDCSRDAPVFVCGPLLMMKEVRRSLKKIGFSPGRIYTEEFSL
jgi:predicted ferric reductase